MSAKILRLRKSKAKSWVKESHNLALHVESGIYYVRKFKTGRGELFKSTGQRTKARAQTVADEMVSEWVGGKRQAGRRLRIDQVIDELAEVLEEEERQKDQNGRPLRRKRTGDKDRTYLPLIKKYFGDEYADEMDEQAWEQWIRTKGRSLNRKLGDIAKYLSKVMTYAASQRYTQRKPKIRNPDPPQKGVRTYSPTEISLFWKHGNQDIRDLIVLAGEVGFRPHENKGLEWDWVTLSKKAPAQVRIPDAFEKRGKGRAIILSDNATEVLRRRAKSRHGKYVFPAPKDPFKPLSDTQLSRYWRRAVMSANDELVKNKKLPYPVGGRRGIRFHWLRHTFFSSALLDAKKPLAQVAAYGGNSPKILFDRYMSKDADRTKEIAGAVTLQLGEEE